eukprot:7332469-Lingulodinium_polyedra.AAC.1
MAEAHYPVARVLAVGVEEDVSRHHVRRPLRTPRPAGRFACPAPGLPTYPRRGQGCGPPTSPSPGA